MAALSLVGGVTSSAVAAPLAAPVAQVVGVASASSQPTAATRLQRDAVIDAMITRDAKVGVPSAQDVQRLKDALSGVDTEVLTYARDHGTRWVIVREGQSLADAGVLRPLDRASVLAQAAQSAAPARAVQQEAQARFNDKLADITRSLDEMGALPQDMGGPGPGPALSGADDATAERINRLYEDLRSTQSARRHFASSQLEQRTHDRVKLYNPAEGEAGASTAFHSLESINTPHTLEQMARMHGAKTPEEVASFVDAVNTLNADTLPTLQMQSLQRIQSQLANTTDAARRQQLIGLLSQGPDGLPLDHENTLILVPNVYDYRPAGQAAGPAMVVDYHDYASLQQWNDASGQIKHVDPKVYTVSAEHFDHAGMNTIVIRDTALYPGCAVHELGHSVESIIERTGAPFAQQLEDGKTRAYENPGPRGYVTDYAATSANENLAEGFALHYNDPSRLRVRDPGLSRLVDSEIAFIRAH
mgnify:CR=1 FL=1